MDLDAISWQGALAVAAGAISVLVALGRLSRATRLRSQMESNARVLEVLEPGTAQHTQVTSWIGDQVDLLTKLEAPDGNAAKARRAVILMVFSAASAALVVGSLIGLGWETAASVAFCVTGAIVLGAFTFAVHFGLAALND